MPTMEESLDKAVDKWVLGGAKVPPKYFRAMSASYNMHQMVLPRMKAAAYLHMHFLAHPKQTISSFSMALPDLESSHQ